MKRRVWEAIGGLNENYRWHIDNEWLGRLGDRCIPRAHLMEATAPITLRAAMEVRRGIAGLMHAGGPALRLVRHASPFPLVQRTGYVAPTFGMAQIAFASDPDTAAQRQREYDAMRQRFGRIPW